MNLLLYILKRADHLLEAAIEKALTDKSTSEEIKADMRATSPLIEGFSKQELGAKLNQYNVKSPSSGGDISEPMEFNLMFRSEIGPTGAQPAFLRPETAQGIFLNFKRLLDFNNGKLPFAGAQIGHSFRNEIAPRAGKMRFDIKFCSSRLLVQKKLPTKKKSSILFCFFRTYPMS